ncbi:MAG: hypothetical protein L0206_15990, partial [Actinobacteria bacterium]|nr:hypothetical protein [Actinomycetota bacterium]
CRGGVVRLQLDSGGVPGNGSHPPRVPRSGMRAKRADSKRGLAGDHAFPRGSEPQARDVEVES